MTDAHFFLLMSAIYIARTLPHWGSGLFGLVFLIIAVWKLMSH